MAAVTLRAVLTEMPVILVVTAPALRRHLDRARRLVMALGALQLGVRTQQGEMSLFRVIENPQRPAVGRVTGLAFLAESAFVHVVVRMAVDARARRPFEGQRRVALRTADDPMQPQQRKTGQIVIENDVGPPSLLAMAGFASALELAAVRVFAAVAAGAVLGKLLRGHGRGMTGITVDLGVCAHQGKLMPFGMIVIFYLPALVVMTVFALPAEAPGMRIVGLVAAVAVLRNLILVIAAPMAGDAVDPVVHAQ